MVSVILTACRRLRALLGTSLDQVPRTLLPTLPQASCRAREGPRAWTVRQTARYWLDHVSAYVTSPCLCVLSLKTRNIFYGVVVKMQ